MWNNNHLSIGKCPNNNHVPCLVVHCDTTYWQWVLENDDCTVMAKIIMAEWDEHLAMDMFGDIGYEYTKDETDTQIIITATPYRGENVFFYFYK